MICGKILNRFLTKRACDASQKLFSSKGGSEMQEEEKLKKGLEQISITIQRACDLPEISNNKKAFKNVKKALRIAVADFERWRKNLNGECPWDVAIIATQHADRIHRVLTLRPIVFPGNAGLMGIINAIPESTKAVAEFIVSV
jgi:hypothetical protein